MRLRRPTTGPASTSSAAAAAESGLRTAAWISPEAPASFAPTLGRAEMAGSARWVLAMIGRAARRGWSVSSATVRSAASRATSGMQACSVSSARTKMETAWAAGASCWLPHCSERSLLRQRRLHRDLLDGQHLAGLLYRRRRSGLHTDSFNTQGWFVGGGVENNLNFFGINAPGWFMKTEYRAAYL